MNENEYNTKIGMRIKDARKSQKITLKELGSSVGISESTTKRYEDGQIKGVDVNIIKKFANALSVSPAWLMGYDDAPAAPRKKGVRIPVLGYVAAGIPVEAIENVIDEEEIPEEMARHGEYFGLLVHGDSMTPTINDGDIVIIRKQATARTGDIALVMINGDEATVKEIKIQEDGLVLIGHNPAVFPPKFFTAREIETLPVSVGGVVVELRRKFKSCSD